VGAKMEKNIQTMEDWTDTTDWRLAMLIKSKTRELNALKKYAKEKRNFKKVRYFTTSSGLEAVEITKNPTKETK
jgi:hypothetical protein